LRKERWAFFVVVKDARFAWEIELAVFMSALPLLDIETF